MIRRVSCLSSALLDRHVTAGCVTLFTSLRGTRNNRHDSNNDELTSTYFDMQDVDADRLNHHYWNSFGLPYEDMLLMDECLLDENGVDITEQIPMRDRRLLRGEYL
ncbi:uncharacterized protein TM35_000074820 [Trypanosoma theileri]|uniref:Uncharacterized protein n=1 Tax=Trypanosoma theileri TaxID=67003 RepID=A0A1X0P2K6_9TRYP|nr:uncharacterized protein TM35_000074820 [Trypanosoma theileri]ORC91058.1 hypothetical protein TM35_000074820 [Trypanosoma theileri]